MSQILVTDADFREVLARLTRGVREQASLDCPHMTGLDHEVELVASVATELACMMGVHGHDIESDAGEQWAKTLRIAFCVGMAYQEARYQSPAQPIAPEPG